ncbi:hypothetical protein [Streptomyces antnestii]|uniref:hypothetical protein n=1 Tax=Streptomyces antnestii TaxID=2494256 RepID=UPI001CB8D984|nr:hypothetical protein [Streptomyces sp. San01]
MVNDVPTSAWGDELEKLFLRVGACFGRVEPRRRMRDYVRGLLVMVLFELQHPLGHDAQCSPQLIRWHRAVVHHPVEGRPHNGRRLHRQIPHSEN